MERDILKTIKHLITLLESYEKSKGLIEAFGQEPRVFFDSRFLTESSTLLEFIKEFYKKNGIRIKKKDYINIIDYYELIDDEEFVYGIKIV